MNKLDEIIFKIYCKTKTSKDEITLTDMKFSQWLTDKLILMLVLLQLAMIYKTYEILNCIIELQQKYIILNFRGF